MKRYEVEQKYRIKDPAAFRKKIRALKARKILSGPEKNDVFDLKPFGMQEGILRLRKSGGKGKLTFKGPRMPGRFKKRIEIETAVDYENTRAIFAFLNWKPACRYEKIREEYRAGKALVTLDYLKNHGWFAEIEAKPRNIHALERKLGLKLSDREPRTYLEILGLRFHRSIAKAAQTDARDIGR